MNHLFVLYLMTLLPLSIDHLPRRQLLVFAGSASHASYARQLLILDSDIAGVADRDIQRVDIAENSGAYSRYKVMPGQFCVILVGKDGTEKFRSSEPVSLDTLFGLIDAMPMRKQEIRKKNSPEN